jgi:hypothetical protein
MNRFRAWGAAAVLGTLAVGAVAPAFADDPSPLATSDNRPWYKKLFFSPPPQTGPIARSGSVVAVPGIMHTSSALPAEMVADAVTAEYKAWERRMEVCLKLREVAIDRNDKALERQVDELERQINALYVQRVGALGVPKTKAPLPPPSASSGFVGSFTLAPEKPDDPREAAAKLVAPAQPVPASGSASLRPGPGSAPNPAVREVQP